MVKSEFHGEECLSVLLLLIFLVFLPFLSGCATRTLWDFNEGLKATNNIRGEADQVYMLYGKDGERFSGRLTPKYCVPVQMRKESDIEENEGGVESIKGYLVFQGREHNSKASTGGIDKKIESIRKSSSEWDIISLYAFMVDGYTEESQLNMLLRPYSLEEYSGENRKGKSSSVSPYQLELNYLPPFLPAYGRKRILTLSPSDKTKIELGSVDYYSFGINGNLGYLEKIDLSQWKPVIDQEKCPFPVEYYLLKPKRIYDSSLPIRVLGTPLAVTFDIITSPIQLILFLTMDSWLPR